MTLRNQRIRNTSETTHHPSIHSQPPPQKSQSEGKKRQPPLSPPPAEITKNSTFSNNPPLHLRERTANQTLQTPTYSEAHLVDQRGGFSLPPLKPCCALIDFACLPACIARLLLLWHAEQQQQQNLAGSRGCRGYGRIQPAGGQK